MRPEQEKTSTLQSTDTPKRFHIHTFVGLIKSLHIFVSFHALYHQILLPMRGGHIFNGGVDICQPVGPINNWRNNDLIAKLVMLFLSELAVMPFFT